MDSRPVVVGAIVAAGVLWLGSHPVPDWALVGFVVLLVSMVVVLSVKRIRVETRLARAIRLALRRH